METLHPGLYMQEVSGEKPIEGVSTSTAAFVGITEKGPVGEAVLVTNWPQFVKTFGSYIDDGYLAYAVRGFFENGGTRAYISRVVHFNAVVKTSLASTISIQNSALADALKVDALYDGTWGDNLSVEIDDYTAGATIVDDTWTLIVKENGVEVERFELLTFGDIEERISFGSKYITVTVLVDDVALADGSHDLAGGDDGLTDLADSDYVGSSFDQNGLYAFDGININILAVPGVTSTTVIEGIETYVDSRQDCVAVVEPPLGKTPTTAKTFKQSDANISSAFVNFYYPWIIVSDPVGVGKNPTKTIPPSGHIVGCYARTDAQRGVWKAPAGTECVVRGALGLEYNVTDGEQDILNPIGVNCIRAFPGEGVIIWGARTCSSDPEYKYTNVRRSINFIEQSIMAGTRWSVFEPNNEELWGKLKSACEAFLRGFWSAGGLRGKTEAEAFFVQCDETTTTPDDIDVGKCYCNIGVAPQKPAEFIVFRVSMRK